MQLSPSYIEDESTSSLTNKNCRHLGEGTTHELHH